MRRQRQNLVRIVNPITEKKMTSLSRAQEYVRRGLASWSTLHKSIKFNDEAQIAIKARVDREKEADTDYWNAIVRERKGNPEIHEMHYILKVKRGFGPRVSTVQFLPCLVQK